jgi:release factor glutamine methyltransferase
VRIADAGTGSGCLAVALAHEFPAAHVVATDRSLDALRLARLNAGRHGVDGRVRFVLTDLLAGLRGPFDLVVANPPYVPEEDWPALPPEVRDYEPRQALEGGPGGLAVLARLVAQARPRLAPRGRLVVEIGAGQAGSARALLEGDGWHVAAVHHDLQGWPRVLVAARGARPGPERHGG